MHLAYVMTETRGGTDRLLSSLAEALHAKGIGRFCAYGSFQGYSPNTGLQNTGWPQALGVHSKIRS